MRSSRLLWQLIPSFLLLSLLPLALATAFASRAIRSFYIDRTVADLTAKAQLVEAELPRLLAVEGDTRAELIREVAARAAARLTIVAADGTVLADSEQDAAKMDNHAVRPEVAEALSGAVGHAIRYSRTVRRNMLYLAVPARRGSGAAVVRAATPLVELDVSVQQIRDQLLIYAVLIGFVATCLGVILARRISRPLEVMRKVADHYAQGQFGRRLPMTGAAEIDALAVALNEMAARLDERVRAVLQQRNELEAVLGSMVEGVLAIDRDARILRLNPAAAELFGVEAKAVQGRMVHEVLRNVDLQRFADRALAGDGPVEGEITVRSSGEPTELQAQGSPLLDGQGEAIGALIVLNNVTRLKRLENIRRDFVANVSHELRTPVTTIKGFIETLLDGGDHDVADQRRFLETVLRHAERLNAIIEDLLTLSRIEQEAEHHQVEVADIRIERVLQQAVQACELRAAEKSVTVELQAPPETWRANAALLEEAVVNLIDNAIKYSEPGSTVQVEARTTGPTHRIQVTDHGHGIAAEHLPRLFERFYRVDKARSRNLGGTGLGLAIVKHIVGAHGGRVEVESQLGQGSTFTIELPS